MYRRIILATIIAAFVLMGAAPEAVAQETASIQALATVISGLSIAGNTNLQFGTVTPGVNKAVNKNEPGFAGEWTVTGTVGAELTLDFTLPDSMVLVGDSTLGLPVAFNGTDASWDDGSGGGQLAPSGTIDPNGLGTERLGAGGQLTVWIGGTASPRIAQTGGDYAADVILSVAYTGN
jgi:hypothetical protein